MNDSAREEETVDRYLGKRLDGRYEILEMIGSGGMANVYRAHDRLENTDVAVKILREEFLGNEDFVRRFKNESKAISLLSHPNIVKVYDVNFSASIQCIVMELIDGITLKDYIDRQGQLGWRDAVHFTEQILRALQHAHDRGIVHRDIKPQNIMLLTNGSIKVMDFGIARFARSETRTITDKAIGSVHYISPEQAKGDATDAKADIYSTGVMLYEMLVGKLPFESDSPVSVAIKQISDTPQSLIEQDNTIPLALEEITFKAMAKDPTKRYQSAAQMLRDFDEFKRNPSIKFAYKYIPDDAPTRYVESARSTRPQPPAPKSRKKKRRGGVFITVSLSLTFACVVGAAILLYMVLNISGALGETEDVPVPRLIGKNINDVKKNAEYNFKWDIEEVFNSEYGTGVIFAQTPVENMIIKSTGTVKLMVSKGTEIVSVPQIKGLPMKDAIKLLQERGLVVTLMLLADSSVGEGQAYRTSPENGESVKAGSVITLYINPSTGGSMMDVIMPEVVGMMLPEASALLMVNRIKVKDVIYEENEAEKGRVIAQDILKGAIVPFGHDGVILKVSEGPSEKQFSWTAQLPYAVGGETTYRATATLNGEQIFSSNIKKGPTKHTFDMLGKGEATLIVYVSGQVIYELRFNFDDGTSKLVVDNRGNFQMTATEPSQPVDKNNLQTAINMAETRLTTIHISVDGSDLSPGEKWVTQAEHDALKAQRQAAQAVYDNSSATQQEVNSAASSLNSAIAAFDLVIKEA
ncbi:MAG: Stk1 family PASTA domain-containing Ser/Thr kinase [Oscillospiraceae bacterium]|nr:Stk1 family PASTA domain-containing Ser/Thr kinase [Oscillospiraceae bacterium]